MTESDSPRKVDVLIIGGGLAGLSAADALTARGFNQPGGPTFALLEAQAQLGGRTRTDGPHGYLDLGGQYFGDTHYLVTQQIARFGLPCFQTFDPTRPRAPSKLQLPTGEVIDLSKDLPPEDQAYILELDRLIAIAATVLEAPWRWDEGREFDKLSVADRMAADRARGVLSDGGALMLEIGLRSAFSVEPEEISFLHFLLYAAAAGNFESLMDLSNAGGAEQYRLTYGTRSLVDALGGAIPGITLGTPVRRIHEAVGARGVVVTASDGSAWEARRVICATTPQLSMRLEYDLPAFLPALEKRRDLVKGLVMGRTLKGFAIYSDAFWDGKCSYVLSAADGQPLDWVMDNRWRAPDPAPAAGLAPPDRPASLMFFIVADSYTVWSQKSAEERKSAVIDQLVQMLGTEARDKLVDYQEKDWGKDPVSFGCPAGCMKPGTLTRYGEALRAPIGRIHWAGTETATRWTGYMNGALESGIRAAVEVTEALALEGPAATPA